MIKRKRKKKKNINHDIYVQKEIKKLKNFFNILFFVLK